MSNHHSTFVVRRRMLLSAATIVGAAGAIALWPKSPARAADAAPATPKPAPPAAPAPAAQPAPAPAAAPAGFQGAGPLVGVAPDVAAPPYKLRWKFKAGDGENRATIAGSLVIAADTVFIPDSTGHLTALDLKAGEKRWQYKSPGGFETAPLVFDGRIYIGDTDGFFHCVDAATGQKIWAIDTATPIHASANVAPAPDGKGHVLIFGNDGADILALSTDGKKVWEAKGGDRINACPAVAPASPAFGSGVALITGCDARLLAVDVTTGREAFVVDLGGPAPGSPAVATDRIIVGTGEGDVQAIDPKTRKQIWKYDQVNQGGSLFYSSPAIDEKAGVVVIGCRDRQVHAIDLATGKRAWAFVTRGDVDASPVISAGRVYVGSQDKKLYVLDLKTGKKLFEYTAARGIDAGCAIGNNAIVFGDTSGNVYCLEPEK